MRYAAIDIGTNTFHLIIVEQVGLETRVIYKDHQPVKLGEGSINQGFINEAAMARAVAAFTLYREKLDQFQVGDIQAVATSAVRSARNGQELVRIAKERFDIVIHVIDGDREAELIYRAVQASGALTGISMIIDIGGGSTEFIIADPDKILWKKSYELGASRLWQKYFHSDPINVEDEEALTAHLQAQLFDLYRACEDHGPLTLIGTAGAFESYVTMLADAEEMATIQHIDLEKFEQLFETLRASTHQDRLLMKGLIPLRVDMIVAAAFLTQTVLNNVKLGKMVMTTYDLKMGILASITAP